MTFHRSQDILFREGTQYTAPNAADNAIWNHHFYRHVIEEPKPTPTKKESETSHPTRDGYSKPQTEEPFDDSLPAMAVKNS
jgi:hypothetical protein